LDESRYALSRYDNKSHICSACGLAEAFVNTKDNACILHGDTPKDCGVEWDMWVSLVLKTRERTTDRLLFA
jgi:hypothetical protein